MLNDDDKDRQSSVHNKNDTSQESRVRSFARQEPDSSNAGSTPLLINVIDSPVPPQRSAALGSWHVAATHALFIVLGWGMFAWSWVTVLSRPVQIENLLWLMGGAGVLVPAITLAWIMHNVGINRRKGPRRSGRATHLVYELDFHGRRIIADWDLLRSVQRIEISLNEDGTKRYRASPASPSNASSAQAAGSA